MKRAVLAAALALFPLTAMGAITAEPVSDLRPPRPEMPPPPITERRDAWVLGGIGAVIILVSICWPRRKPPVPPPRPYAVAHEKFDALRASAAADPAAVSSVVRQYASAAFSLTGGGLTSEEVVSGLVTRRACPAELTNAVWHFLSDCDRAEFSPIRESADGPTLLASASKLVDELEAARAKAARTL